MILDTCSTQLIHSLEQLEQKLKSSNTQSVCFSKDFLQKHIGLLQNHTKNQHVSFVGFSPIREAFSRIKLNHPEINYVIATYQFHLDREKGCPFYINLNKLYQNHR